MKKVLLLLLSSSLFFTCGTKPTNEESQATEEVPAEETAVVEITGFDNIEDLSTSLVKSLQEDDYEGYFTHVMSEEMELAQAEQLTDEAIKKEFLHEYGFSLHDEEEFFEDLVKYYKENNIDLTKATVADMEYTEYKGGEYAPLKLYEVFIPIEMDYELLIDFTVIEVDGKYFLTSELGI